MKDIHEIELTPNQQQFCLEYLKDMNGSRAYKAAYPHIKNDNTAAAGASRLLRNGNVSDYIGIKLKELEDKGTADALEVIMFLSSVMRGEEQDEVPLLVAEGGQELALKSTDVKDRLRAAELIGKRYGLFTDKVDLRGNIDTNVNKLDGILEQLKD